MNFSLTNQLVGEVNAIVKGYPWFIFFQPKNKLIDTIPIFTFHTIDPVIFEKQLQYLQENNVKTLSIDEYYSWITKRETLPSKAVLLTFDDGRTSFWKYGYPLIKKYNMKATLFVIPGSTLNASVCRPNILDVWNGKETIEKIAQLDPEDETLCTWPEIKTMHQSGHINIESHTLFHKEVFVSPECSGVISHNTPFTPHNSSITPYLSDENIGTPLDHNKFIGLPLFKPLPLLKGRAALTIPSSLSQKCQELYCAQPPQDLNKNKIEKIIKKTVESYFAKHSCSFQTQTDVELAIKKDLITAKSLIQEKLGKTTGNHLCLPYGVGSKLAIAVTKKIGIKSCFWSIINWHRHNSCGSNPYYMVRIKNDFIWRLPGKGRKSLASIYAMKINRRLKRERVF